MLDVVTNQRAQADGDSGAQEGAPEDPEVIDAVPLDPEALRSPTLPDFGEHDIPGVNSADTAVRGSAAPGSTAPVSAASGSAATDARAAASLPLPGAPSPGPEGHRIPRGLDDPDPHDAPRRRGRWRGNLPAWAILGIVAVQAVVVVLVVTMVTGTVRTALAPPAPATTSITPSIPPASPRATPSATPTEQEKEPGTVTDAEGEKIAIGTGPDDPATVGEHTFAWEVWTSGTLSVTAREVDTDAQLPGAEDLVADGYQLVIATYEVRYDGPARLAPVEELWPTAESARRYYPDIAEGLVDDPMRQVDALSSGESATFRSVFMVPTEELDSFLLAVETYNGERLYYAAD